MTRRSRVALMLIFLLTALAAGARAPRDPAPSSPGIATPDAFARRLDVLGADVRPAATGEACTDPFVRVPGRRYEFGRPQGAPIEMLCLYPYDGPDAAVAAARVVPKKADLPAADWAADVRYFRCGAVIAQYLGGDDKKVGLLTALCGSPFSTAEGWGPDT